ncbi:hypothetical protein [Stenotrophobium rhamnosiphilum]|uniref:Uncharacterized protein n=1 Tax=Stenotrophobium rhamnosiphilum TaxID=2029166 RepID=A0A2T5MI90_9GAMM|nr:hypothetical protein [Stenotrophobium rhamnosiphilum]PTU32296.1 hypothetical protein CJD38_06485 [Stenotrophobium rhamnosiphilum]
MNKTIEQRAGNSTDKSPSKSQDIGTDKVAPEVTQPSKTPEVTPTPVIPEIINPVSPTPGESKPILEKNS